MEVEDEAALRQAFARENVRPDTIQIVISSGVKSIKQFRRIEEVDLNEIVTEMNSAKYECPICLDKFSMAELYTSNCVDAHRCCFECASIHVDFALENSKVFS
jgi:hypothetical protein